MPKVHESHPAAAEAAAALAAGSHIGISSESKEFKLLHDQFSEVAGQLGIDRVLFTHDGFDEYVASAAACRAAQAQQQPNSYLSQTSQWFLSGYTALRSTLELPEYAAQLASFHAHCMLAANLDAITHQLLLDPQLPAVEAVEHMTILILLCNHYCLIQLDEQESVPPHKATPRTSLLEPSHLEARLIKVALDPQLIAICFNNLVMVCSCKEADEEFPVTYNKYFETVCGMLLALPDQCRVVIVEVLKDARCMNALWAAMRSPDKMPFKWAILFLSILVVYAPESDSIATGKPPANSLQSLLQMGASRALPAALKRAHHLIQEQIEQGDENGEEMHPSMILLKTMDIFELGNELLRAMKSASKADYDAACAWEKLHAAGAGEIEHSPIALHLQNGTNFSLSKGNPNLAPWPRRMLEAHMQLAFMVIMCFNVKEAHINGPCPCEYLLHYPPTSQARVSQLLADDPEAIDILMNFLHEAMCNQHCSVRHSQSGPAFQFLHQMLVATTLADPDSAAKLCSALPLVDLVHLIASAVDAALEDWALLLKNPPDGHRFGAAPTGSKSKIDAKSSLAMSVKHALLLLCGMLHIPGGPEAFQTQSACHKAVLKACDLVDFRHKKLLLKASKSKLSSLSVAATSGIVPRGHPTSRNKASGSGTVATSGKLRGSTAAEAAAAASPELQGSDSSGPTSVPPASASTPGKSATKQAGKVDRTCDACGKVGKGKLKCGRCQRSWFCNAQCQLVAWPLHKRDCKAPE